MEQNDTRKPRITENTDYNDNGEYAPGLSPEQREELYSIFNRCLTEFLGERGSLFASALGDYL